MKKIFKLGIISLSTLTVHAAENNHTPYEQTKAALCERYEGLFGRRTIDYTAVEQFRDAVKALELANLDIEDSSLVEHIPTLIPYAQKLSEYLDLLNQKYPEKYLDLKKLNNEIAFRIDNENVTPQWFHTMALRVQASISTPSEDEIDFISHVINPGEAILKGLLRNNAWKSHDKSFGYVSNFLDKMNLDNVTVNSSLCDDDTFLQLRTKIDKLFPAEIYYPLTNTGKLSFTTLMEFLVNDIHPICLPTEPKKAHGLTLSPLSFSLHDYLHATVDPRRPAAIQYFFNTLADMVSKGDIKVDSAESLMSYTVGMYNLFNEALKTIWELRLKKLNDDGDLISFKRFVAGMHLVLHENFNISPEIYGTNTLQDALKLLNMSKESKKEASENEKDSDDFEKYFNPESPFDPFNSSPLSGDSINVTDEFIKELPPVKALIGEQTSTHMMIDEPTFTNNYVDVTLHGSNAQRETLSFPTLFYKWNNVDDSVSVLQFAGEEIQKPDLSRERRKGPKALEFLKLVEDHTEKLRADFINSAVQLVEEVNNETNTSFAAQYATKQTSLQTARDEALKDVKLYEVPFQTHLRIQIEKQTEQMKKIDEQIENIKQETQRMIEQQEERRAELEQKIQEFRQQQEEQRAKFEQETESTQQETQRAREQLEEREEKLLAQWNKTPDQRIQQIREERARIQQEEALESKPETETQSCTINIDEQ